MRTEEKVGIMAAVYLTEGEPIIEGRRIDLDSARIKQERKDGKILFVLYVDFEEAE